MLFCIIKFVVNVVLGVRALYLFRSVVFHIPFLLYTARIIRKLISYYLCNLYAALSLRYYLLFDFPY